MVGPVQAVCLPQTSQAFWWACPPVPSTRSRHPWWNPCLWSKPLLSLLPSKAPSCSSPKR